MNMHQRNSFPNDRRTADRRAKALCSRFRFLLLQVTVLVACFIPGRPGSSAEPNPGDPLHGTWRVALDGFFEPAGKKNGGARRTLPIYVISREGRLLYGLGSAPDWNQATHPTDVSALRYDAASGKLTGTMQVKLNPDPWIPKDHQPIACSVEVDATLDRAQPTNQTALQGSYRAKLGTEPVQGTVSGYIYTQPLVDLAHCQLALTLNPTFATGRVKARSFHVFLQKALKIKGSF